MFFLYNGGDAIIEAVTQVALFDQNAFLNKKQSFKIMFVIPFKCIYICPHSLQL